MDRSHVGTLPVGHSASSSSLGITKCSVWSRGNGMHIFPNPHRQKQNRAPNLCFARRREDDIQSGRVTDVVRTTTAAPAESRINSGCPLNPPCFSSVVLSCSSTAKPFYPPAGLPTRSVICQVLLHAHTPTPYDVWGGQARSPRDPTRHVCVRAPDR